MSNYVVYIDNLNNLNVIADGAGGGLTVQREIALFLVLRGAAYS